MLNTGAAKPLKEVMLYTVVSYHIPEVMWYKGVGERMSSGTPELATGSYVIHGSWLHEVMWFKGVGCCKLCGTRELATGSHVGHRKSATIYRKSCGTRELSTGSCVVHGSYLLYIISHEVHGS